MEDSVAWGILVASWILLGSPILGSELSIEFNPSYKRSLMVGLGFQLLLVLFGVILFSIVWAINTVIF